MIICRRRRLAIVFSLSAVLVGMVLTGCSTSGDKPASIEGGGVPASALFIDAPAPAPAPAPRAPAVEQTGVVSGLIQDGGVPVSVRVFDSPRAPGEASDVQVTLDDKPLHDVEMIYDIGCETSNDPGTVLSVWKDVLPKGDFVKSGSVWINTFKLTVRNDFSKTCVIKIGAKTENTPNGTLEPNESGAGTLDVDP